MVAMAPLAATKIIESNVGARTPDTVEWIHGAFQGSQVPPLHFRHIVIFLNSICLITLV
jgi:hypothetical protein